MTQPSPASAAHDASGVPPAAAPARDAYRWWHALCRQRLPSASAREWGQALGQMLPVWLLLVLAIVTISVLAYQQAADMRRQNIREDLRAQAHLKASQIQHWLHERHDEAAWLTSGHQAHVLQAWLADPVLQGPAYERLREHFLPNAPLQQRRRYVLRHPADGRVLVVLPVQPALQPAPQADPTREMPERALANRLAMHAARTGQIQFDDLHHLGDDPRQPLAFCLFVPIHEPDGTKALAVLQLTLAPEDFLYPMLTSWPGASSSGETLLVRREGEHLRYLNPLRGSREPVMQTQRALSDNPRLIARQILQRGGGFYEAVDYRGVPCLAYGLPVAGTPWLLVVKLDAAEAWRPLQLIAWLSAGLLSLTLLLAAWWLLERRLHEQRLSQALAEAEDLYQHAPCGYHALDAAGCIQRINNTELAMLGYAREDMLGRPISDFMMPASRATFVPRFPQFVAGTREQDHQEMEFQHRDGHPVPVQIHATALRATDGRFLCSRTVVLDISTQRELEARQRLLQHAIEASFDAFAVVTRDEQGAWRFNYCNPAFERITGYSAAEIIGRTPDFLHGEDDQQDELLRLEQAVAAAQPYQGILRNYRKDGGMFWTQLAIHPIHDSRGRLTHYVSIQKDITASHENALRLEEKREQLRQLSQHHSQLLEAERQRIARELHDDLGQQLTALKMHINLLQMHYDAIPGLFESADDMLQIANSMRTTIRQAVNNLRPAALDLGIVSALEWLAEHHSRLSGIDCHYTGLTSEPPIDDAIATALLRTAQEALTNALRHAGASRIELHLDWQDDCLQLCISDNGRGFDPQQQPPGQHFGLLGLQERALALGGTLRINSCPGQGCTILISVPLPSGSDTPTPGQTPIPTSTPTVAHDPDSHR